MSVGDALWSPRFFSFPCFFFLEILLPRCPPSWQEQSHPAHNSATSTGHTPGIAPPLRSEIKVGQESRFHRPKDWTCHLTCHRCGNQKLPVPASKWDRQLPGRWAERAAPALPKPWHSTRPLCCTHLWQRLKVSMGMIQVLQVPQPPAALASLTTEANS